jgi:hypothetical protein
MISSAGNRPFFTRVCFEKPAGKPHGIDAGGLPPGAFVACAMRGPVMHAAERDREFIARFAAQRAWLHVAQMMGIGWLAAAHEAVACKSETGTELHIFVDFHRTVE